MPGVSAGCLIARPQQRLHRAVGCWMYALAAAATLAASCAAAAGALTLVVVGAAAVSNEALTTVLQRM
mgnify:CR=1 FL=1